MKTKEMKIKRIISVIALLFFVFSFLLLLFSLFAVRSDIALFGYRFFYVTTESMEPDIMAGSLIIAEETPIDDLKVGDIISFVSDDPDIKGLINTHNIHKIDNSGVSPVFTTKGTNNPTADKYPVYPENIKGRVVYNSHTLGEIFRFLSKRWVSFCLTVVPIAIIVLINLVDFIKVIHFFPDDVKEGNAEKDSEKEVDNDD
ncbi:MAG: signal peptidase I [Ruminococcaceae bacterium]|nr:signal peptidase I [Oscillospiraceae bacterium]